MAIFRDFSDHVSYTPICDAKRHRKLVEKSIRENIDMLIVGESITETAAGNIVKVRIQELPEYRFKFGSSTEYVAIGDGDEVVNEKCDFEMEASNEAGLDIYESEIVLDDALALLFEQLELPNLYEKKFKNLEYFSTQKRSGIKKTGIYPRFAKKRTLQEKIIRNKNGRFINQDIRYQSLAKKQINHSNAVIVCIMDTSGSMGTTKKDMAKSFYFLLYQFIKIRYAKVEMIFIAHSTIAKEVTENDFFHKGESGGTYISSGYTKALEIIKERYDPRLWNVYTFHCSDGDNWTDDNNLAVSLANELCSCSNLFGYIEIKTNNYSSVILNEYNAHITSNNFLALKIFKKSDIFEVFKKVVDCEVHDDINGL
ncbi:DUF444 family protein [Candidatus Epulonipiscium viviparus]|uniref:DUF444 family protein n=1 Tax=Candidatus Epulonipiscium viviparus TaxID=420336 RepID=UPI00016C05A6|nr:DUF444 family protein [Candidatus Epulopiscium viviparus]